MRLPDISVDSLREAVRLYLDRAYPGGVPGAVLGRLGCLSQRDLGTALDCAGVEIEEGCDGPRGRFALRLGSADYPHVRLLLERCSGCDDFVFSVDTHDTHFLFGPEVSAETRQRFEVVQEKNRRLKCDVERDWTAAGLPTFERFIHDGMAALRAPCHDTA